ncbi:MAG: hypothetical protein K2K85_03585 [Clostridia bacterium]|nr:hypothetical protein [Clostridia bacterium]
MKQKNSAILKMLNGELSEMERFCLSEEYHDATDAYIKKSKELETQLKKYPQLLSLYREVEETFSNHCAIYADDVYIQAFSYGLAIGQEVFGKKYD